MTPDLVYHYTTAEGLLGIIASAKIRLTDIEFMNDAEEILYPRENVVSLLRSKVAEFDDPPELGYETLEGSRAFVLNAIADDLERLRKGRTWHAYAACFCEASDLLSQWRGYSGGAGFSIGFKSEKLAASPLTFEKVSYGLDLVKEQIEAMVNEITPGESGTGHPNAKANILLMTKILPRLLTIKNPAFSEEQEWRLTVARWGLENPPNFGTNAFGIAPYLEEGFDRSAIATIMVGPGNHSEIRAAGVRQLLEVHGLDHVTVEMSKVPFRS